MYCCACYGRYCICNMRYVIQVVFSVEWRWKSVEKLCCVVVASLAAFCCLAAWCRREQLLVTGSEITRSASDILNSTQLNSTSTLSSSSNQQMVTVSCLHFLHTHTLSLYTEYRIHATVEVSIKFTLFFFSVHVASKYETMTWVLCFVQQFVATTFLSFKTADDAQRWNSIGNSIEKLKSFQLNFSGPFPVSTAPVLEIWEKRKLGKIFGCKSKNMRGVNSTANLLWWWSFDDNLKSLIQLRALIASHLAVVWGHRFTLSCEVAR